MDTQENVRVPTRWRRGLVVVLVVLAPVAILTWPWRWLPERWRYSAEFRQADRVIKLVQELRKKDGRYPSADELKLDTQAIEYIRLRDGFQLVLVQGFDEHYVYDSRGDVWERLGVVDEKAVGDEKADANE